VGVTAPPASAAPCRGERLTLTHHGAGPFETVVLTDEHGRQLRFSGMPAVTSRLDGRAAEIRATLWLRLGGGIAAAVRARLPGQGSSALRRAAIADTAGDVVFLLESPPEPAPRRPARGHAAAIGEHAGAAARAAAFREAWAHFAGETLSAWFETAPFTLR